MKAFWGIVGIISLLFIIQYTSAQGSKSLKCVNIDSRCRFSCGDGVCDAANGETPCLCPQDCKGCCLDGVCRPDRGENSINCRPDCGVEVKGYVIRQGTNQRLAGVEVRCQSSLKPSREVGPVYTGPSGEFLLDKVDGGVFLCVAKYGYQPKVSFEVEILPHTCNKQPIVVAIPFNDACIVGEVTNCVTGRRVPEAQVQCSSPTERSIVKMTGPFGTFFYQGLTPSSANCTASATGYVAASNTMATVAGYNTLHLTLCPIPGTISGIVSDCRFNNFLNQVQVSCTTQVAPGRNGVFTATTDTRGAFTIPGVPPGRAQCSFTMANYVTVQRAFVVESAATSFANIPLCQPTYRLDGWVRDWIICHARGIPRATVTCVSDVDSATADTHNNGQFAMDLRAGNYTCTASAEGFYTQGGWNVLVTPRLVGNEVYINLNPIFGTIQGRVYERYNALMGIAQANVTCYLTSLNLDGTLDKVPSTCSPQVRMAVTDANGNFAINENFRNGYFVCNAYKPGYLVGSCGRFTVPGGVAQVDVTLVK